MRCTVARLRTGIACATAAGATSWLSWFLAVTLADGVAFAHDPRFDPPDPQSVPEAWNVIRQCADNVGALIETNQLEEIAYQVADCSPAIRLLQSHVAERSDGDVLREQLNALFATGGNIILASREPEHPHEKSLHSYELWRAALKEIEDRYKPELLTAEVYICPMHPLDRHLVASERCAVCGMGLVRRRIVASSVYEKPGEPSMKIVAIPDHTLEVGRAAHVTLRIAKHDGKPVVPDDLLVMHTQRIHLLINDASLGDYHHEHPAPTGTPGEYAFTFTPRKPGPYRIWADVVPAASSIQEYLITDMPSETAGEPIRNRETRLHSKVDGLDFELTLYSQGKPLRVGEAVLGRIEVRGRDGRPFSGLEPIMGTFAHIVGFNEDRKTVVHIHPMGNDPQRPTDRGGPTLQFKFYPPAAGFTRLYCQVNVGGESKFAPFGVNVLPTEGQPARPESANAQGEQR